VDSLKFCLDIAAVLFCVVMSKWTRRSPDIFKWQYVSIKSLSFRSSLHLIHFQLSSVFISAMSDTKIFPSSSHHGSKPNQGAVITSLPVWQNMDDSQDESEDEVEAESITTAPTFIGSKKALVGWLILCFSV
jgi:hypothetical protein